MSANRPGPSGLFPNLARTRDDLSSAWVQMFRDLSTRVRESGLDPDAPAQQPTYNPGMERFGAESLYDERQTGQPQMTPEAWAETRQWGSDILFGPERESAIPGMQEASRVERFFRDWGLSEQEFGLSRQRFSEGRLGAGFGWGALGIAALVPVAGDAVQGAARLGRAGRAADDVAAAGRAARSTKETDPLLKEMDDLWHSEAQTDWLYAFGDVAEDEAVGRTMVGGRMVTVPNRFDDLFRQLDDQFPGVQEFAGRYVESFDEVYEYRVMLQEAMAAGGRLPDGERMYSLWAGLRAMEVSPPTRSVAYRAMRVTPDEAAQWQRGLEVDLPVSSFSYTQGEVWQYFDVTGNQGGLPTNVMFVLEPGARALPLGALTSETAGYGPAVIGEIATAGTFRVTNVQTRTTPKGASGGFGGTPIGGEYLEVTVEQISPFAVEEIGRDVFVRSVLGQEGLSLPASRAAETSRVVSQNIVDEIYEEMSRRGGQLLRTIPASRLENIPEQRRNFAEILNRQGFDRLPTAVDRGDFRVLMADPEYVIIYRGIRGGEATRGASMGQRVNAEDAAFDFISGDLYPSGGTAGSGAYFTTDGSGSTTFATGGGRSGASSEPGAVVAAALPKNAKIFDYSDAGSEFMEQMRADGFEDLGEYLAAQGYDAIRFGDWTDPTLDIAVLNRSALTVMDEPLMFQPGRSSALRAERLGGGDFPYEQTATRPSDILESVESFEETGRTLYHGTPATFERFDSSQATRRGQGRTPTSSEGYFYFSDDPNIATSFRQNVSDVDPSAWFRRNPDFDYEDLRDPEIFGLFIDDVKSRSRGRDLQIARDPDAVVWRSIDPDDITIEDVVDLENPIRAVSSRGQVVETRVFGNEIDLSGSLNPSTLPPGLMDALRADDLVVESGSSIRIRSWKGHEKGMPNTVEWMRENGYGRAIVPDAFESGGSSVVALEEYIEFGRTVEDVFDAAKSAARRGIRQNRDVR